MAEEAPASGVQVDVRAFRAAWPPEDVELTQRREQRVCLRRHPGHAVRQYSVRRSRQPVHLLRHHRSHRRRDAELQILGNTVSVIRRNERTLQRADSLFGFAVLLLFLRTLLGGAMRENGKKKSKDASPGDATATTQPLDNPDDRPKSILPPPDPELNGTQKRGLGVFKRGPGAV